MKVKIVNKVNFSDIAVGVVFEYKWRVFIKIEEYEDKEETFNAICIISGQSYKIYPWEKVSVIGKFDETRLMKKEGYSLKAMKKELKNEKENNK